MWSWFTFYLIVHVLGVLIAFGPSFAYPFFGMLVQKYPQAAAFFVDGTELIAKRLTLPLGVIVALSGVGLIYTAHIDLWQSEWLIVAIVLYAAAYSFGLLVQVPTGAKLLHMLHSMGPPPAGSAGPPGPPAQGGEDRPPVGASGPPAGPPPEVARLTRKLRLGGAYLSASVLVIAILMMWRPGGALT